MLVLAHRLHGGTPCYVPSLTEHSQSNRRVVPSCKHGLTHTWLSRFSVHLPAAWCKERSDGIASLRASIQRQAVDDIRCSASMIYTPLGVIWVQIHRLKTQNIFFIAPTQRPHKGTCCPYEVFFLFIGFEPLQDSALYEVARKKRGWPLSLGYIS